MTDTAQNYQKLLSDALQKQMIILGRQITLAKARHVPGLTVNDDGHVTDISDDPQKVVIQFLETFRELSSPLVKKTMQPLLTIALPVTPQPTEEPTTQVQDLPKALPQIEEKQEDSHHTENHVPEQHLEEKDERKEETLASKA